jgi:hypothetical protein
MEKPSFKLTNWQIFLLLVLIVAAITFLDWTALEKNVDGIALGSTIAALVGIAAAILAVKIKDILFGK